MLVHTTCGHCSAVLEVSQLKIGKKIVCSRCDSPFVAQIHEVVEAVLDLEAEQPDVQAPTVAHASVGSFVQKHALMLPPPPVEEWNDSQEDEEERLPGQRFSLFRPSRKRLKEFLDTEGDADDYSWLLIAGLVIFAVILMAFMVGLIVILLR
jgi:hypothetical protein